LRDVLKGAEPMEIGIMQTHKRLLIISGVVASLLIGRAGASAAWERYIPPEVLHARQLGQTVSLPATIDINHASLNQLKIIPGFDENLALKIIRVRPLAGVEDIIDLPGVSPHDMERILQHIQSRLEFK